MVVAHNHPDWVIASKPVYDFLYNVGKKLQDAGYYVPPSMSIPPEAGFVTTVERPKFQPRANLSVTLEGPFHARDVILTLSRLRTWEPVISFSAGPAKDTLEELLEALQEPRWIENAAGVLLEELPSVSDPRDWSPRDRR